PCSLFPVPCSPFLPYLPTLLRLHFQHLPPIPHPRSPLLSLLQEQRFLRIVHHIEEIMLLPNFLIWDRRKFVHLRIRAEWCSVDDDFVLVNIFSNIIITDRLNSFRIAAYE